MQKVFGYVTRISELLIFCMCVAQFQYFMMFNVFDDLAGLFTPDSGFHLVQAQVGLKF